MAMLGLWGCLGRSEGVVMGWELNLVRFSNQNVSFVMRFLKTLENKFKKVKELMYIFNIHF